MNRCAEKRNKNAMYGVCVYDVHCTGTHALSKTTQKNDDCYSSNQNAYIRFTWQSQSQQKNREREMNIKMAGKKEAKRKNDIRIALGLK